MPHDDFISNDLVNMRERLRRNYEEHQRNSSAEKAPQEKNGPPQREDKVSSEPNRGLPVIRTAIPKEEDQREFRELEGRLLRDLTSSQSFSETLAEQVRENEKFHELAGELLKELQEASQKGCSSEQLRSWNVRYWSAAGRWNRLCSPVVSGAGAAEAPEAPSPTEKCCRLLAAAILLAAFIIAGALIALWA